jgi:Helix-turn-helix domain
MAQPGTASRVAPSERSKLLDDLKPRYESGESIRALAQSCGRSYGFVHRLLTEGGTTMRTRCGATRGRRA